MKVNYESILGIAYSSNAFMGILIFMVFSVFILMYLHLIYKCCIKNKYGTNEEISAVLFGIILIGVFIFLIPLISIVIMLFVIIKALPNKKKQSISIKTELSKNIKLKEKDNKND